MATRYQKEIFAHSEKCSMGMSVYGGIDVEACIKVVENKENNNKI